MYTVGYISYVWFTGVSELERGCRAEAEKIKGNEVISAVNAVGQILVLLNAGYCYWNVVCMEEIYTSFANADLMWRFFLPNVGVQSQALEQLKMPAISFHELVKKAIFKKILFTVLFLMLGTKNMVKN